MNSAFAVRLALWEGRSGVKRVAWFLAAVILGVAALVALYGFQRDAASSARSEARVLLGGDLRLQSSSPFDPRAEEILDSLSATGAVVARGTSLASVASVPGTGRARLLQVNAVDARFPAAGSVTEDPRGTWSALPSGGGAAADPQVFAQLGVAVGETLRVGTLDLRVLGSVSGLPVDFGIEWVAGPPLYIALEDLPSTGLTGFGSLAQHRAWVSLPAAASPEEVRDRYRDELRVFGISIDTAQGEAEGFARGFANLSRFLGLAGLLALLLGGIGVGSAVHVYLGERRPSIAVLRCLGATRGTVFAAYLLQTFTLGALGAGLGVILGVATQFSLPGLLEGVLPFALSPRVHPEAVVAGWILGTWVSVLFSLFPLLEAQAVSPLTALRADVEPPSKETAIRGGAVLALVFASLLGLCAFQLGDFEDAAIITASVAAVIALLAVTALGLAWAARRLLPETSPFAVRQGLAGLFRPGNQTGVVVTALGLGAFFVGTLLVVERHLRAEVDLEFGEESPTLILFDIQRDQTENVRQMLRSEGLEDDLLPIVPARIRSVAGRTVQEILAQGARRRGMYSRLYRNTYREDLGEAEEVVAGLWWGEPGEDPAAVREAVAGGAARISIEQELAEDLDVGIGDEIEWDVQGVPVRSVIASLRVVEWSSLQPNFFAVFEPGALDEAPATFVAISTSSDAEARARVQAEVLRGFPNVSFLDVALVQETLGRLGRQVGIAFRALAGFILAGGVLVLFASLLTSRFKRRRESALLKTLGASGRTIRGVLLSEYGALGGIAAAAGLLLGGAGGHLLLGWQFDLDGNVPWTMLASLWAAILVLSLLVGWSVSGPVLRAPPLDTIREDGR